MSVYNNISVNEKDVVKKLIERTLTSLDAHNFKDITKIRSCAFFKCVDLKKVIIPDTVVDVSEAAFNVRPESDVYCPIEEATCPAEAAVAIRNASLKKITITSGTTIRAYGLSGCTSLIDVSIANTVTTISGWAFNNCTSLTNIILPSSVSTVGYHAFYGCSNLVNLTVLATTPPSVNGLSDILDNTPIRSGNGYIYVPASSVDAYKAATGWSRYANKIVAILE